MKRSVLYILIIFLAIIIGGCTAKEDVAFKQDPEWVENLIKEKEGKKVENPPASIRRCFYKNQIVYYIPSPCCDQYNYLYNINQKVICAPDGGFSGSGDDKCSDFSIDKNSCETIWQDSRPYPPR